MAQPKKKKPMKIFPAEKARTMTQVLGTISERTGLTKKDVSGVFEEMSAIIKADLGKKGPGVFTVPRLMKIKSVHKAKRPARKGVNPFTGVEMMFKAKPARNIIKVVPMKALKEMV